ncbi:hypothetical protein F5X96DRAFT_619118, partial [Biscogniauxia mediterranea]
MFYLSLISAAHFVRVSIVCACVNIPFYLFFSLYLSLIIHLFPPATLSSLNIQVPCLPVFSLNFLLCC